MFLKRQEKPDSWVIKIIRFNNLGSFDKKKKKAATTNKLKNKLSMSIELTHKTRDLAHKIKITS